MTKPVIWEQTVCRERDEEPRRGVYFDEAWVYDLLRHCTHSHPLVPFVCVRILDFELPTVARDALAIATGSLGARGFVDIAFITATSGAEAAEQALRDAVLSNLRIAGPDGDIRR